MTAEELSILVLGACLVFLAAVAAVRISSRSGMPGLLLYLGIGLLLGPAGLGIRFDDDNLAYNLATIMLVILLIDGGFTTDWNDLRPVVLRSGLLASVGVAVSVAASAALAMLLLGVDLRTAVLLGGMVSSTDAAATFSVLRRLPVHARIRSQLEGESGFNDAPAMVIVVLAASNAWGETSPLAMIGLGIYELVAGAVIGLVIARIGQVLLSRVSLPSAGLYPLAVLAIAMAAFATAGIAHASGLLAAYSAGLWLGNKALPHQRTTEGFTESLGWLAQIGLFILLGLLASPSEIPAAIVPALVLGAVVTFVARPLSVAVCLTPFRTRWREQAFTSWAGLRGAVPIMLATVPLTNGYPGASRLFHIIFVVVIVLTLLQGPTLPFVARRTGVLAELEPSEVQFDSSPLEGINVAFLQVEIPHNSKLSGMYVADLRLPKGVVLSMIVREKKVQVPTGTTRLHAADRLLLTVPNALVEQTQNRLRLLSHHGTLARWIVSGRNRRTLLES